MWPFFVGLSASPAVVERVQSVTFVYFKFYAYHIVLLIGPAKTW